MRTRRIADALRVRKNGFRVQPLIIFIDRVIIAFNPKLLSITQSSSICCVAHIAVLATSQSFLLGPSLMFASVEALSR